MFRGKSSSLKWIFAGIKQVLWKVALLTLMGILLSYIAVEFAMASRILLDCATGASDMGFSGAVIRLLLLLAADLVLRSIYNVFSIKMSNDFKNRLQRKMFSDVVTRQMESIGEFHSGEIINRLTNDIRIVSTNIIEIIPTVVTLVSAVVLSFLALIRLDMSLALMCMVLGPVVIFGSVIYGKYAKRLHKDVRKSDGSILSFMQECVQNLMVIKAFSAEGKAIRHTTELQKENYRLNMKMGYVSLFVNIIYFVAMTAAYYFAVIWCARKIHIGIMTVGTFTAIIQLVGDIQSPFREISGTLSGFFGTLASAERIMEIENLSSDDADDMKIRNFEGLEIKDISFSYGEEVVFEKASLSIEKGDIAVISGPSGIGKSTLFKLLLGIFSPHDGEITVQADGLSIPLTASCRSLFAYVPQGNMIISGSIAKNIAFFEDCPSEEKLRDAAECACILDYIDSLPDGFDTVIGENGLGLSEGQVQRLAVARAMYYDAPVILLDEATSALDEAVEAQILSNIKMCTDKTCLIITHKDAAFGISTKNIRLDSHRLAIF